VRPFPVALPVERRQYRLGELRRFVDDAIDQLAADVVAPEAGEHALGLQHLVDHEVELASRCTIIVHGQFGLRQPAVRQHRV